MKLKVGDVVEFKKYEDMNDDERSGIDKRRFPCRGTVSNVYDVIGRINIQESPYSLREGSVARVISDVDDIDIDSLKPGDEVLVKVTIKDTFNEFAELIPLVKKTDVTKILKRKEPEHFIVQEDHYGMYISGRYSLSSAKSEAKIYTSRNTANADAADMHLNAWDVIPYDD